MNYQCMRCHAIFEWSPLTLVATYRDKVKEKDNGKRIKIYELIDKQSDNPFVPEKCPACGSRRVRLE